MRRFVVVVVPGLGAACLSAPPPSSVGPDAAGRGDGGQATECAIEAPWTDDFSDPADRWSFRNESAACQLGFVEERLRVIRIDGDIAELDCNARLTAEVPVAGRTLSVTTVDFDPATLGVYVALVLGDGSPTFYLTRRAGDLGLGYCDDARGCDDYRFGQIAFDPVQHARWQISHDAVSGTIWFATAAVGQSFQKLIGAQDALELVVGADPGCGAIEIGANEGSPGPVESVDFDDLVIE